MAPRPPLSDEDNARAAILKNFADVDDEDDTSLSNEPSFDTEDDADDDIEDDQHQQQTKQDDNDEDDAGDDDTTGDVVDDDQQMDEETAKNEQFKFKEDREGNFIDKDGNIVVRKGKQRDLFVKIKKAYNTERTNVQTIAKNFQETVAAARELLTRYNNLKATKTYAESVGLTDEEAKTAADLHALMKLDPKAGIRKVLTMLHLGGTDLSDIGVKGPLDAKTVAEQVLALQEARRPKEKSDEDKAREEVEGFLGRHPDARQYVGALAEAKRRFPVMSYDQIWFQLLLHAKQKGAKPATDAVDKTGKRPTRTFPKNSQRPADTRSNKKLSLKSVDPSMTFSQIGRDLLRDIRELEQG